MVIMAKRYKAEAQPSAPVELVLGAVALVCWLVGQAFGWARVLIATTTAVVVLGLAHTAVAPVRGVGSTWGVTAVLAPAAPTVALVAGDV